MREERAKVPVSHSVSGVFVFLLLGIFALFGTAMVLLGVQAYRKTAENGGVHHVARITSSYLRSMVRSEDETGALRLEEAEGIPVLTLISRYDEEEYATRLYVWEGALRESFAETSEPFKPADGEEVCEAEAMEASLTDELLHIRIRTRGEWQDVDIALRAGGQGAEG